MQITIDLNTLLEHGLSADDYVFLVLINKREYDIYANSAILPDFDNLELNGWVTGEIEDILNVRLTERGNLLLGLSAIESEEFAMKYRNLFKGTVVGALGDEYTVKARMKWFQNRYNFDNETILVATVRYINSNRRDRFKYMMAADNFIQKHDDSGNPVSKLAAYCEDADTEEQTDGFQRM